MIQVFNPDVYPYQKVVYFEFILLRKVYFKYTIRSKYINISVLVVYS